MSDPSSVDSDFFISFPTLFETDDFGDWLSVNFSFANPSLVDKTSAESSLIDLFAIDPSSSDLKLDDS